MNAASYRRHGYFWYVTGQIPTGKDPHAIDRKLIAKYDLDLSEWERSRRKKQGLANVQFLRHDRWFILLVTEGHHAIKSSAAKGGEGDSLRDCRRTSIRFAGYAISYCRAGVTPKGTPTPNWHARVRIDGPTYKALLAHFETIACHRSPENLARELATIPFARYAPSVWVNCAECWFLSPCRMGGCGSRTYRGVAMPGLAKPDCVVRTTQSWKISRDQRDGEAFPCRNLCGRMGGVGPWREPEDLPLIHISRNLGSQLAYHAPPGRCHRCNLFCPGSRQLYP